MYGKRNQLLRFKLGKIIVFVDVNVLNSFTINSRLQLILLSPIMECHLHYLSIWINRNEIYKMKYSYSLSPPINNLGLLSSIIQLSTVMLKSTKL